MPHARRSTRSTGSTGFTKGDMKEMINLKKPGNKTKKLRRPFSLVEIVLVVSIVALIATISTVGLAPILRGRGLQSGAGTVQTVLRQARSEAAHTNRNVTVFFELAAGEGREGAGGLMENLPVDDPDDIRWTCPDHPHVDADSFAQCPETDCDEDLIPQERVFARHLPVGIGFAGNPAPITFTPLGSLKDGSAAVTIGNGGTITIRVIGASGLVRVGDVQE